MLAHVLIILQFHEDADAAFSCIISIFGLKNVNLTIFLLKTMFFAFERQMFVCIHSMFGDVRKYLHHGFYMNPWYCIKNFCCYFNAIYFNALFGSNASKCNPKMAKKFH